MKHLRKLNTKQQHDSLKANHDIVASVGEDVYLDSCSHWVSKYQVTDTSKPTTLIGDGFTALTNDNAYMQIDGVEQEQLVKEYQFDSVGQHEVSLDSIAVVEDTSHMYEGATELVSLDFSQANQVNITASTDMFEDSVKTTVKENQVGVTSDKVIEAEEGEPTPQYEYVDLGLPSGTLWATCNVGATKPEEYGLYFQWGDTIGYEGNDAKEHSTWATAPFNNGQSSFDKTYFATIKDTVAPNNILAQNYDAAHVHMSGEWRIPSVSEFEELIFSTNHIWTTENGIQGTKFVSETDESKYIFIPATGSYCDNEFDGANSWGNYWINTYYGNGERVDWFSMDSEFMDISLVTPELGLPIRGVMSKPKQRIMYHSVDENRVGNTISLAPFSSFIVNGEEQIQEISAEDFKAKTYQEQVFDVTTNDEGGILLDSFDESMYFTVGDGFNFEIIDDLSEDDFDYMAFVLKIEDGSEAASEIGAIGNVCIIHTIDRYDDFLRQLTAMYNVLGINKYTVFKCNTIDNDKHETIGVKMLNQTVKVTAKDSDFYVFQTEGDYEIEFKLKNETNWEIKDRMFDTLVVCSNA